MRNQNLNQLVRWRGMRLFLRRLLRPGNGCRSIGFARILMGGWIKVCPPSRPFFPPQTLFSAVIYINNNTTPAISDQFAYGRPTAMRFFLNMYQDLRSVVAMSVPADKSSQGQWLCLDVPTGPGQEGCKKVEFCTMECFLSWYLQAWDVKISIDWGWNLRIKRP
jgi:hypothetical protein